MFSELTAQRVCSTLCQKASPGSNTTFGGDWDDTLGLTDEELAKVTEHIPALSCVEDGVAQEDQGHVVQEVVEPPERSWLVATRTRGARCLHQVGKCWRKAGRDLPRYEQFLE